MKRKWMGIGIVVVLIVSAGIASFYGVQHFLQKQDGNTAALDGVLRIVTSAADKDHQEPESTETRQSEASKFVKNGLVQEKADWTETQIMRTLHEMTHQKVKASEKWGAVPMTLENIKAMIDIVQKRRGLDHYSLYMDMLSMWKKGNFSQTVKQHNKLWSLEHGTVGKASGLMNEKQEQAYIKANFGDVKGTFHW